MPACGEHALGDRLVHRQGRGQHAGMGVGNAHDVEQALDAAVLAEAPMQRVEHHRGLGRLDAGDQRAQRRDARRWSRPRSRPARVLRPTAAPQRSETSRSAEKPPISTVTRLLMKRLLLCATPMRRISQSSADAAGFGDAVADLFAQCLDIGGGGCSGIDQEVAVLLGNLRAAALQAAAPGVLDQFPGLCIGRIGEGRAAGARAEWAGSPRGWP